MWLITAPSWNYWVKYTERAARFELRRWLEFPEKYEGYKLAFVEAVA